jgi:hypothetical protein
VMFHLLIKLGWMCCNEFLRCVCDSVVHMGCQILGILADRDGFVVAAFHAACKFVGVRY